MVESDGESGRQWEGSERESRKHAQKSKPSSSARRALEVQLNLARLGPLNPRATEGKLKVNTPLQSRQGGGFLFGEAEVATVNGKNTLSLSSRTKNSGKKRHSVK
jgi:hypothetical protein